MGLQHLGGDPQAHREALLSVYGAQDLVDFEAFGGYVGYRVGITESGERIFLRGR